MGSLSIEKTIQVLEDLPEDADGRYHVATALLGSAIARLAGAYEADAAEREDLLQKIHLELWRSLKFFDGRCTLRTWVYRVAHNVAADHVARASRRTRNVSLDEMELEIAPDSRPSPETEVLDRHALSQIYAVVHQLKPIDRQVMVLYLEEESAATISDVSGLSPRAVATRIHRIKRLLAARFGKEVKL